MRTYLFTFTYKGHTVEYTIQARSQAAATRIARQRERAWRAALEAMSATHGSQTDR
jgi:hypothetical protein